MNGVVVLLTIIAGLLALLLCSILLVLLEIDRRIAFLIRRTRWSDHDWPGNRPENWLGTFPPRHKQN
jgi:hypothetical protein